MPSRFDEFWSHALRKIAKKDARKAYVAAIRDTSEDKIMTAWIAFNKMALGRCGVVQADHQFIPYPATWIRQERWEDEYDTPTVYNPPKTDFQLQQIATQVKASWYEFGRFPREVLEQCVAADLLTREQMEAAL